MNSIEQYDERIKRIMAKIKSLEDIKNSDCCGEWPPEWKPPISEKKVADFEKKNNIRLPEDYRRFITTVAASGSQPFYGLQPYNNNDSSAYCNLKEPFRFDFDNCPYFLYMTEEEMDAFDYDAVYNGFITICTEGCAMDSILIVNSDNPEVYGTVWFFDLANDFGLLPMCDEKTGKPFSFLDWLEYWADKTAEFEFDDDYFSYGDTVKLPPLPDNTDIMGRKMGWID